MNQITMTIGSPLSIRTRKCIVVFFCTSKFISCHAVSPMLIKHRLAEFVERDEAKTAILLIIL